ncbi:MAG: hypothetical protein AB1Z65_03685 [Candidatus Sulfomarinibacteraceae bacterium]
MNLMLHRIRRRAPFAVFLCVLFAASNAVADDPCTKTFVPGAGPPIFSWHDDSRWLPFGAPGPTDVACILEPGSYQVTVDSPVAVAGLRIDVLGDADVMVKIIAVDFTLNGPGFLVGSTKLKVNDGAILRTDGGGVLEARSKLVIEGGTVEIDIDLYGTLNWWGPSSVTGVLTSHPGSIVAVDDPQQPAHLTIASGFTNHGSIILSDNIEQSLTVTGGALVNSKDGVINAHVIAGVPVNVPELHAELDNRGLVDVAGVDLVLGSDGVSHTVDGSGEIRVADAELVINLGDIVEVPSNFTNYGSITVAGGGSIRVNGSAGASEVPSNFTNYGSITVAGGGSIRVNGSAGAGENVAASMVNFGLVDLKTGGELTLTGAIFDNPEPGGLTGGGVLDLTAAAPGSVFAGTLNPGSSPGIFTVQGDFTEGSSAQIVIEIGGTAPGAEVDRLDVTGTLSADGNIEVGLLHPYHPVGGEQFQVVTFDSLTGGFDSILLPPLQYLLTWDVVTTAQAIRLDVGCQGTQLGVDIVADNNPVSIGDDATFFLTVANLSSTAGTNVVVTDALPPNLVFNQPLSSPGCVAVGSSVECTIATLPAGAVWPITIVATAAVAGAVTNPVLVDSWECDVAPDDNLASVQIDVVAAVRCDANYDLSIDSDDVAASVDYIFGAAVPGNPDCRIGGGVTADDLAATIVVAQ